MAKTEWQKHLMATYKKLKSKNKDAMLSDAMKIAGKTYKKKAVKGGTKLHPLTPKELGGEPQVVDPETEEEEVVDTEVEDKKPVMDGGKKKRKTSKKAKKSKRKTGKKK
jgi:hypothetical protein